MAQWYVWPERKAAFCPWATTSRSKQGDRVSTQCCSQAPLCPVSFSTCRANRIKPHGPVHTTITRRYWALMIFIWSTLGPNLKRQDAFSTRDIGVYRVYIWACWACWRPIGHPVYAQVHDYCRRCFQKVMPDLIYINSDDRFKYFKYLSADTNHLPAVFVYFGQPKH